MTNAIRVLKKLFFTILGLVVIIWLHADFFRIFPNPLMQSDTDSYLRPAFALLFDSIFPLSPLRTPGYPLFIATILSIVSSYSAVLVVQHLLMILSAACAGLIYRNIFNGSVNGAALVTFICALLARPLIYAHTLMSDNLYAFMFTIALTAFLLWRGSQKNAVWTAVGSLIALASLVRPVAWSLLAAVMLGTWLLSEKNVRWRALTVLVGTCLFWLLSYSAFNLSRTGYFGLTRLGPVTLFGSTAYLLDPDSIDDPAVRAALKPLYKQGTARFQEQNWVMWDSSGPGAAVRALRPDVREQEKLFSQLARQAVLAHPFRYATDQTKMAATFFLDGPRRPRHLIPKKMIYLASLQLAIADFKPFPKAAALLAPDRAFSNPAWLDAQALYPFDQSGWSTRWLWPLAICMNWLPIASLLSLLVLLVFSDTRRLALFFLALIIFHVVLSDIGAGIDGRYGIPLEPIYVLLFAAAVRRLVIMTMPGKPTAA